LGTLAQLLQAAIDRNASDIHIKTDSVPFFRVDGEMIPQCRQPRYGRDKELPHSIVKGIDFHDLTPRVVDAHQLIVNQCGRPVGLEGLPERTRRFDSNLSLRNHRPLQERRVFVFHKSGGQVVNRGSPTIDRFQSFLKVGLPARRIVGSLDRHAATRDRKNGNG